MKHQGKEGLTMNNRKDIHVLLIIMIVFALILGMTSTVTASSIDRELLEWYLTSIGYDKNIPSLFIINNGAETDNNTINNPIYVDNIAIQNAVERSIQIGENRYIVIDMNIDDIYLILELINKGYNVIPVGGHDNLIYVQESLKNQKLSHTDLREPDEPFINYDWYHRFCRDCIRYDFERICDICNIVPLIVGHGWYWYYDRDDIRNNTILIVTIPLMMMSISFLVFLHIIKARKISI